MKSVALTPWPHFSDSSKKTSQNRPAPFRLLTDEGLISVGNRFSKYSTFKGRAIVLRFITYSIFCTFFRYRKGMDHFDLFSHCLF